MRAFVEDIFKQSSNITVDKKAEFGKLAQVECDRSYSVIIISIIILPIMTVALQHYTFLLIISCFIIVSNLFYVAMHNN